MVNKPMTLEELEDLLTEVRDNHEDQAIITEKLQAIREGFSTLNDTLSTTQNTLTESQEKYLSALEVNGRLHNQLGFQNPKGEDKKEDEEPEPLTIKDLFADNDFAE